LASGKNKISTPSQIEGLPPLLFFSTTPLNNRENNMDVIIQKSQQAIPQFVQDALGALFFLLMIWGASYLFLLLG
jgi:hypothetical protein